MSVREAAIVVIRRPDGRLLAVSRGENTRDWGFPGGRRDRADVDLAATAVRELAEETGIHVPRVIPVYDAASTGGTRVVAFVPVGLTSWPKRLRSVPFEGYVGWLEPAALVAPTVTYRDYHRALLERISIS